MVASLLRFHGSYEAINGGQAIKALEDFTGGIGETFRLGPKAPPTLLSIMLQAHKRDSLMCCSIDVSDTTRESRFIVALPATWL